MLSPGPDLEREGLIVRDDFRLHWIERRSFGQRFLEFEIDDFQYPIRRGWSDLPLAAPPGWAPVLQLGVFEGKEEWKCIGEGTIRAYGLPSTCLRTVSIISNQGNSRKVGLRIDSPRMGWRWFPTWVYWPGMIGNLLVWNVVALALFGGFDVLVGLRRIQRGRCVRCGYDIGVGGAMCPECGAEAIEQGAV